MAKKRNPKVIRAELLKRGKTLTDVAAVAQVSRPLVSRTVSGLENNRKTLHALVAMGVPKALLALPADMRTKGEAA
ncbi:hypothetical protein [Megalodesulfovibrio gigas]|uniref:hypothetical protein n=1 Tax=Megalodesulfovibrio gigas TaxID=879 RepID=UPI0003F5E3DD|nr:hypothetical protein [Megalodesulfovibrio gigas]